MSRRGAREPVPEGLREPAEDLAGAPGRAAAAPEAGTMDREAVLALERSAGNAAVARMLARRPGDEAQADGAEPDAARTGAQQPTATGTPAPAWGTQAQAQATAQATLTLLTTRLLPFMSAHADPIVRNTAELFTGTPPMLTMSPITKRSDSPAQLAKPTTPTWAVPATHDAFFTGVTMNNVMFSQKDMIGTLRGTVMLIRGHDAGGSPLSLDEIAGTVTHECSHFFVKRYGELPQTSNASSFDRYADEFRAYWVEHGDYQRLAPKEKAEKIRRHLVGTKNDASSGYSNFRGPYWAPEPPPNVFKQKVDALAAPIGFNLTNSIRLDNLFTLFQKQQAGTATVNEVIVAIDALPPSERKEAAGANLIATAIGKLAPDDAARVRAALNVPTVPEYTEGLNPKKSPAVSAFLTSLVGGKADEIKAAYVAMPKNDRGTLAQNPAFLVYVDHHQEASSGRACTYALTETGDPDQYNRMAEFLAELSRAKLEADAGTLTAVPPYVTAAMGRLQERARWALFAFGRTGAMKDYVSVLPEKIAWEISDRLRD